MKLGTVITPIHEHKEYVIIEKAGHLINLKPIENRSPLLGLTFHEGIRQIEEKDVHILWKEVGCLNEKELERALREVTVEWARKHAQLTLEQEKTFDPLKAKLPPSGKVIDSREVEMMVHASLDAWLTAGRFAGRFEREMAQKMNASKFIAVNSGSSANLIALSALTSPKLGGRALRAGDEVISAAAGFPTTINPILQNQLVPVLVDSNADDANINVDQVEAAITSKTKAIMAAHTLGNPMDMIRLRQLAKKHNLFLIEDCCDALGSKLHGQDCGTFGDLGTLSFYPAHHMTMGEGGGVFGQDMELMKIAESFRDWGRDCYCDPGRDNSCGKRFCQQHGDLPYGYDHKYTYSHAGYNLKITDMQAACGLAQLEKLTGFIEARKRNHAYLLNGLKQIGALDYIHIQKPIEGADPSWFGFLITIRDSKIERKDMVEFLEKNGIGTRLLFAGNITRQPYFKDKVAKVPFALNVADDLMKNAFWIGIWPGLTKNQLDYMIEQVGVFLGLSW